MIKAILFDIDRILYSLCLFHIQAWQETMKNIGIVSSIQDFYLLEGRTRASTIQILFNRFLK